MHTNSCAKIIGSLIDEDLKLSYVFEILKTKNKERVCIKIHRDLENMMKTNNKIFFIHVVL